MLKIIFILITAPLSIPYYMVKLLLSFISKNKTQTKINKKILKGK